MRLIRLLKQDLAREVDDWLDEDIINEEQQTQILARYGIVPGEASSLSYQILIGLGIFFIGLSLITLIGANWEDIPRYVRTFGLIALTAATHVAGWYYFKRGEEAKGVGLIFLGNFFYGAAIILIAQIFHLGEHMPDGVYWWALGCLPMVLLTRSRAIAIQMLGLAVIWLFMETGMSFFPVTFPLFVAASVYVLMHASSLTLLVATFGSAALWLEYLAAYFWSSSYRLDFDVEHVPLTASMFACAYGFSHWLMKRTNPIYQDYGAVLSVWCLRFIIVFLLILSFEGPWDAMIDDSWRHVGSMSLACLVLWAGALFLGYQAEYYRSLVAFALLMLATVPALYLVEDDVHAVLFQFVYNLAIVGLGIWLVVRGIRTRISHYFWAGVISIVLVAMFRYFDLVGNYVGGSILFLFIAAILLGAARYWRSLEVIVGDKHG